MPFAAFSLGFFYSGVAELRKKDAEMRGLFCRETGECACTVDIRVREQCDEDVCQQVVGPEFLLLHTGGVDEPEGRVTLEIRSDRSQPTPQTRPAVPHLGSPRRWN